MPSAEIITIGTEILLGEILDTNARTIAVSLRENGFNLYRKTSVGDNVQRISQIIQEALARCDIVITTGGLGPTVDDPTREAVALAMGVVSEFRPELWEQIQARFRRYNRQPTENNRRQAFIPHGAIAIENPVGTAPAFLFETGQKCIISLPGVPSEMNTLLHQAVIPYLRRHYQVQTVIQTRTLHTAGIGESQIDDLICEFETLSNPTVGLAAHSGQVDVRLVARADTPEEAEKLIQQVEAPIHQRLEDWVYGIDKETLEAVALAALERLGWKLAVVEAGSGGELSRRLAATRSPIFRGGLILAETLDAPALKALTRTFCTTQQADLGIGITILPGSEQQQVTLALWTPQGEQQFSRPYGGPPEYAARWATHHSLDILRKLRKDTQ